MAPHDEEDDPAVYRSGSHKSKSGTPNGAAANGHGANRNGTNANDHTNGNGHTRANSHGEDAMQEDEDEEDEDNGTLLTVQPGFNRLLLVLRDEGVMRFVKYVSAAAQGSRWDVCGEFEVGMVETDD